MRRRDIPLLALGSAVPLPSIVVRTEKEEEDGVVVNRPGIRISSEEAVLTTTEEKEEE